jgi:hypothetical protein
MGGGQPRDARRSDRTCHPGLGGTAVSQGTHPEPAMRAEGLAPGLGRQILEHAPSGGRPPVPTVHPTASVGTRGNRQTRTRRNVRSGTAATPKAGGHPWRHHHRKGRWPPAYRYRCRVAAARDKPPVEDPHEQSAELGRGTEPKQADRSGADQPKQAPADGCGGVAPGFRLAQKLCSRGVAHRCDGSAAAAEALGAPPPRVRPAGLGQERAQQVQQAQNRQRTDRRG